MNPAEDPPSGGELTAVRLRYSRRKAHVDSDRYSMLNSATWQILQERQRLLLRLLASRFGGGLGRLDLIEVGCGSGGNLLEFLRFGFSPDRLSGIELLEERIAKAQQVLPASVQLYAKDALQIDLPECSRDIVYQAVVFSSILDREFGEKLAAKMWSWVKPGGAILWYDFVYDNPWNPDVRGVPLKRIRQLFPGTRVYAKRLTLAPPIARRVCAIHPVLYSVFNLLPWLRTHVLCWIEKR